ncbi:MAG: DDE-type integrase/transposase/recombinase [Deltaproteobacteria bacterium]|nr:DDE-type integrase/transposase/recombinase [Deltaproteobacteria bacterium]
MPPSSCPAPEKKPSFLLALVCAAIVAAYDRTWLARPVSAPLGAGAPRPGHLSRLKARLLAAFEQLLLRATRRGRPRKPDPPDDTPATSITGELLALATELLRQSRVPWRRRDLQDRLVAAYDRLRARLTLAQFCAALALAPRTFRGWRARPPAPPAAAPAPPPPPRPRPKRNRGRFALEITAPDTQLGADTSDLRIFGTDLKLVAAQDIGAREQRLFEAFAIDQRESADLIASVVAQAVADRPGLQLITDQGTPYLAQAARQAYEQLGVEHTPQKEATPTEKATVERAFGCLKNALAPLLDLTNRLADLVPALRNPELARAAGSLLCAVFLRVYTATSTRPAAPAVPPNRTAVAPTPPVATSRRPRAATSKTCATILSAPCARACPCWPTPGGPPASSSTAPSPANASSRPPSVSSPTASAMAPTTRSNASGAPGSPPAPTSRCPPSQLCRLSVRPSPS